MSWIDAIVAWVDRRRIPWLVFFLVTLVIGALAISAVKWLDGSTPFLTIDPLAVEAFYGSFAFTAYALLTRAAGRALDRYLPALDEPAERTAKSRRRMTSMPQWQALTAWGLGVAFAGIFETSDASYWQQITTSVAAAGVTLLIGSVLGYGLGILVMWQAVRILAEVVSLHRRAVNVDIFRTEPAHALASVTAGVGIVLLIMATYSAFTDASTFTNAATLALTVAVTVVAAVAFVAPLLGMQRRLRDEKERVLDENASRLESVVGELNRAIDEKRFDSVAPIRAASDSLLAYGEQARKASTWPWSTRTLGSFASTLLLPILIWLITTYGGKLLGL